MGRLFDQFAQALAAFKLQGLCNDPRRLRDLDDMRALLSANRARNHDAQPSREPLLVGEGGVVYAGKADGDQLAALAELMEVVEALCPEWPPRRSGLCEGRFLL